MELVQEMVQIQVEKELKRANEGNRNMNRFHLGEKAEVRIFFGDVEIGTMQSVSMESASRTIHVIGTEDSNENRRVYPATVHEGAITVDSAIIDEEFYQSLVEPRAVSFSYGWQMREPSPNRDERRKNIRQARDEELQDKYRTGIRNMLGGTKKWN